MEAWPRERIRSFPPLSGPIDSKLQCDWSLGNLGRIWRTERGKFQRTVCGGETLSDFVSLTILHFIPTDMGSQEKALSRGEIELQRSFWLLL